MTLLAPKLVAGIRLGAGLRSRPRTRLRASASQSQEKLHVTLQVSGLPLDFTDERLKQQLDKLGGDFACSVTEAKVDKNLLGVCESGEALVRIALASTSEDPSALCERINEESFIDESVTGSVILSDSFARVDVSTSAEKEKDDDDEVVHGTTTTNNNSRTSDFLNVLNLEQYKREIDEVEKEFKHFENTSY